MKKTLFISSIFYSLSSGAVDFGQTYKLPQVSEQFQIQWQVPNVTELDSNNIFKTISASLEDSQVNQLMAQSELKGIDSVETLPDGRQKKTLLESFCVEYAQEKLCFEKLPRQTKWTTGDSYLQSNLLDVLQNRNKAPSFKVVGQYRSFIEGVSSTGFLKTSKEQNLLWKDVAYVNNFPDTVMMTNADIMDVESEERTSIDTWNATVFRKMEQFCAAGKYKEGSFEAFLCLHLNEDSFSNHLRVRLTVMDQREQKRMLTWERRAPFSTCTTSFDGSPECRLAGREPADWRRWYDEAGYTAAHRIMERSLMNSSVFVFSNFELFVPKAPQDMLVLSTPQTRTLQMIEK